MSSSFEEKLRNFTEKFAQLTLDSAKSRERALDRRLENGTIEDNDYLQQSFKSLEAQRAASEVLEKLREKK